MLTSPALFSSSSSSSASTRASSWRSGAGARLAARQYERSDRCRRRRVAGHGGLDAAAPTPVSGSAVSGQASSACQVSEGSSHSGTPAASGNPGGGGSAAAGSGACGPGAVGSRACISGGAADASNACAEGFVGGDRRQRLDGRRCARDRLHPRRPAHETRRPPRTRCPPTPRRPRARVRSARAPARSAGPRSRFPACDAVRRARPAARRRPLRWPRPRPTRLTARNDSSSWLRSPMARMPAMRAPPFSVCSTRFSSVMRPRSARSARPARERGIGLLEQLGRFLAEDRRDVGVEIRFEPRSSAPDRHRLVGRLRQGDRRARLPPASPAGRAHDPGDGARPGSARSGSTDLSRRVAGRQASASVRSPASASRASSASSARSSACQPAMSLPWSGK